MTGTTRQTNRASWAAISAALLALMLTSVARDASAQQDSAGPPTFGFVNLQRIALEAKAAVGAGQKIEAYRATVEARIRTREDAFREEEQSLGRRRSILAADVFREEERKFREKVDLAQREFQEVGRQLQQATLEAQQAINEQMSKIIRDVAVERGINFVLNQVQVTFVQPLDRFEITDAVILRMDETLPEIPVNLPQE
ncbi:MAG: OmpH family outer membrane protein [Alphaproteobacteria bacterium]|nr:OmpH family outer membrane protein [Alphaproteobacteria bacterium]